MKVVVESPLKGDFSKNLRYALWCQRALWLVDRQQAIASHTTCPWFLDDDKHEERTAGINWDWFWQLDAEHVFFIDLGWSDGMLEAWETCDKRGIRRTTLELDKYCPDAWKRFKEGEWPPHTEGFRIAQ